MAISVTTLEQFDTIILGPGLVVVGEKYFETSLHVGDKFPNTSFDTEFFAKLSPPCKRMAPFFDALCQKHPHVKYAKVDVEDASEIAVERNVTVWPTFQVRLLGVD